LYNARVLTRPADASPALFQALVEHSSDAIVLLDRHASVRFASPSIQHVMGYSPEERVGRNAFDLVHDEDLQQVQEVFARGAEQPGVPVACEFRLRHKDGTLRHIEAVAVNRLSEPHVAGIVVNYRDVSQRKRTETALRASEERLRHLFDSARDFIYYCSPDGRFAYVNPTATRVMKYDPGELIGRHWLALVREDYRDAAAAHYGRQLADRVPNTYFELPVLASDGSVVWVGQHVQLVMHGTEVIGVQAIARDISRQRDAELRLRNSEARYRSLIDGAAYGIYCSSVDGLILAANPALAHMLGYDSVEEIRGRTMDDIYESAAQRQEIVDRYLREMPDGLAGNVRWKKKDGTTILVRVSGRLVDFDDGVIGFEAIAEDITARRALEQQLREAQKMEAVGRLARGIAHDFNNVLAAIVGCSDVLQARIDPADESHIDVLEIGKAARRGAALTRQLLAFSRRQPVEPQVLDVHAVVRGFDSMLRRLSGDIVLRLHTPGPSPIVRGDPGQIEQVVMNLVLNARDAVPPGGTIDVLTDIVTLDATTASQYPGLAEGRYARISVHDTGKGIEPALQPHVFEPFFSTKDPAKGTGLGLSIVYSIAREAGGTVAFSSTPRTGTTFEVLLPLSD
jgi:two-component system cell cycle sensor histidine kinase/response regulator CckA